MKNYLIILLFFVGLIASCKHDPTEVPAKAKTIVVTPIDTTHHDSSSCDTVNIKYSVQIKKVLTNNCLRCHGSAVYTTKGSGYNYDDYTVLKSEVDNGDVLKAINHTSGSVPMPLDQSAKISDCEIKIITMWVANGAPNN